MKAFRSKQMHQHNGFTLIELLLVLVILTALAGVVVPRFAGRAEQTRVDAARIDISRLSVQLDIFEVDTGRYPTTEEGLKALVEEPLNVRNWNGPYLTRGLLPKDPWGNPYQYRYPGVNNKGSYDLWSFGSDGREGGGDDLDNWSE